MTDQFWILSGLGVLLFLGISGIGVAQYLAIRARRTKEIEE